MRTEDQTSIHLLLAVIVTVFGVFLMVITLGVMLVIEKALGLKSVV